mmetsp:Transcript_19320/g.46163  ORF Transcript_19320/g.46163 Transcript_19320/m.46163 type:complete len:208 (-) Transcript_19320:154-777(-)
MLQDRFEDFKNVKDFHEAGGLCRFLIQCFYRPCTAFDACHVVDTEAPLHCSHGILRVLRVLVVRLRAPAGRCRHSGAANTVGEGEGEQARADSLPQPLGRRLPTRSASSGTGDLEHGGHGGEQRGAPLGLFVGVEEEGRGDAEESALVHSSARCGGVDERGVGAGGGGAEGAEGHLHDAGDEAGVALAGATTARSRLGGRGDGDGIL